MWICIAPCEHTSKALRYGTPVCLVGGGDSHQGISQFYLHTPHSSANGMNHTMVTFTFTLVMSQMKSNLLETRY